MKKHKLLRKVLSASLALMMLTPVVGMTPLSGIITASAFVDGGVLETDSGSCGDSAMYSLGSNGKLTITGTGAITGGSFKSDDYQYASEITEVQIGRGITLIGEDAFSGLPALEFVNIESDEIAIASGAFANTSVVSVFIASPVVKLHPLAFENCEDLDFMKFSALDGAQIQGSLVGLSENVEVEVAPFSKIYTPARKRFTGPSVAYDKYQPQYDHALLYWEDTESIIAAAQADEAGVSISDLRESLEWITNENVGGLFADAEASIIGTMEGDGSFAYPYEIWTPENWRYLDFLARTGKLSNSYYGWDRGTNVKLMADITLSDKDGTFTTVGGSKHREVYNNGYVYGGNFDGNGHTITLDVNDSVDDGEIGFGLFESTGGAYIKNLHVSGRMVSTQQYTGILVGYASSHDRIYNCSIDAELVLKGSGEFKSGTFVGYSYRTYLENCHFTGVITGDNSGVQTTGSSEIYGVGGFVGEIYSSSGGSVMKNCYFAPAQISGVVNVNCCTLYRPYYGSYSGWCGFEEIENNYYNEEALKLNSTNMGDLDQGTSDQSGISSLNETEFWQSGQLTMPQAQVTPIPGNTQYAYNGKERNLIVPVQAESYTYGGDIAKGDSFPYMPGGVTGGSVYYKLGEDGEWKTTPPTAAEAGTYTVYIKAAGDEKHRDSAEVGIQVSIADGQTLSGSGTEADPYTISSDLDWRLFCAETNTLGKYYKLTKDIVVSETRSVYANAFAGTFDGDGHTITYYAVQKYTEGSAGYWVCLFGNLSGNWDYSTAAYTPVLVKNLTVDGTAVAQSISGIAHEASHNVTITNYINNMNMVSPGYGGMELNGIAGFSSSGGVHVYNCKFGGRFVGSKACGWRGIGFVVDYGQSPTNEVLFSNYYFAPSEVKVDVKNSNALFVSNLKDYMTLENSFFNNAALGMVPVDEETGETTNTQGISDENGLDALTATGYWANGVPTMPKATFAVSNFNSVLDYTGEEMALIGTVATTDGTVWYKVDDGAWTTETPKATVAKKYHLQYKVVGDKFHRDSDTVELDVRIFDIHSIDWAIPANVTITEALLPFDEDGETVVTGDAAVTVAWDDNEEIDSSEIMAKVQVASGGEYWLEVGRTICRDGQGAPEEYAWSTTESGNSYTIYLPTLGAEADQIITDETYVNGIKQGDKVTLFMTAYAPYDGEWFETAYSDTASFVAAKPVSNKFTISASETVKGDSVTLTGASSGGTGEHQYAVYYKLSTAQYYTTLQGYSSNKSVEFKPTAPGTYNIRTRVIDSRGYTSTKNFTLKVNSTLENTSSVSADTVELGKSIKVQLSSEGGLGDKQYAVYYKLSTSRYFSTLQGFGTNTEVTFAPDTEGTYTIRTKVKDSRGVTEVKDLEVTAFAPLENSSSLSADKAELGTTVTVTLASEGGYGDKQYAAYYKLSTASYFTTLKAFSADTSAEFKPAKTGMYTVRTKVKDSRGVTVTKDIELEVFAPLDNTSALSAESVKLGGSITVQLASEGGYGDKQYAAYYKLSTSKYYSTLQAFGENTSVEFKPAAAATYNILTKVRDSRGVIVSKTMDLTAYAALENTSAISDTTVVHGSSLDITLSSAGGLGNKEYAVFYKLSTSQYYSTLRGFGEEGAVQFTPAKIATYNVRTKVKDETGTTVSKDFEVTVTPAPLENTTTVDKTTVEFGSSALVSLASKGGVDPKEYAVYYKLSSAKYYSTLQAFGTNTRVEFKPSAIAEYNVRTKVQDEDGKTAVKDFNVEVVAPLENTSALSDTEITIGNKVTVNCSSKGGAAPVQYAVYTKLSTATYYSTLQAFSENTAVEFTPSSVGTYNVLVKAKDKRNVTVPMTFKVTVKAKPLKVNVQVSKAKPPVGEKIFIELSSEGGAGSTQYAVYTKAESATYFSTLKGFSSDKTAAFTASATGKYTIRAKAKDADGTIVTKDTEIEAVPAPLENKSSLEKSIIEEGDDATVITGYEGGTGGTTYAVYVKAESASSFTLVQGYKANAKVTVSGLTPGKYTVLVKAKDSAGTIASKNLTLNVRAKSDGTNVPKNLKVTVKYLPRDDSGNLTSGTMVNLLTFDNNSNVNDIEAYVWVTTAGGQPAVLYNGYTFCRAGENVPSQFAFFTNSSTNTNQLLLEVPVLSPISGDENMQQLIENGAINGVMPGDQVSVAITGLVNQDGQWGETDPSNVVTYTLESSAEGKTFPQN